MTQLKEDEATYCTKPVKQRSMIRERQFLRGIVWINDMRQTIVS